MDPYDEFEDAKIIEALNDVQLWSVVDENGGLAGTLERDIFSHGQRQLFSLARAIVRNENGGSLLILDEVTSRYFPSPLSSLPRASVQF